LTVVARRNPRLRALVALAALFYVLVVAVVPAFHHDFQCHVQHPGHCDACRAVVAAPDVGHVGAGPLGAPEAADAVVDAATPRLLAPGLCRLSGRAPPSVS
jgi:hypothetical protein